MAAPFAGDNATVEDWAAAFAQDEGRYMARSVEGDEYAFAPNNPFMQVPPLTKTHLGPNSDPPKRVQTCP